MLKIGEIIIYLYYRVCRLAQFLSHNPPFRHPFLPSPMCSRTLIRLHSQCSLRSSRFSSGRTISSRLSAQPLLHRRPPTAALPSNSSSRNRPFRTLRTDHPASPCRKFTRASSSPFPLWNRSKRVMRGTATVPGTR